MFSKVKTYLFLFLTISNIIISNKASAINVGHNFKNYAPTCVSTPLEELFTIPIVSTLVPQWAVVRPGIKGYSTNETPYPESRDSCKIPSDSIHFCFNPLPGAFNFPGIGWATSLISKGLFSGSDPCEYHDITLKPGESYSASLGKITKKTVIDNKTLIRAITFGVTWKFKARKVGDKICAAAYSDSIGKLLAPKIDVSCRIAEINTKKRIETCTESVRKYSMNLIPTTAIGYTCAKNIINKMLFTGGYNNNGDKISMLQEFQYNMRRIVTGILTLFVIVVGIRTMLGKGGQAGEFILMILQALLVIYFSIGFETDRVDVNGNKIYENGLEVIYNVSIAATNSFSNMLMDAAGSKGLCSFGNELYPESYQYLAFWDKIDCRIWTYVGGFLGELLGYGVVMGTSAALPGIGFVLFLSLFISLIIYGQIAALIFLFLFIALLISVAGYVLSIFVQSLFILSLLIIFAPLFVPMVLFQFSKNYFEGWKNAVLAYTLQPVLIGVMMVMLFTIFDRIWFKRCEFKNTKIFGAISTYVITDESKKDPKCNTSIGYRLNSITHLLENSKSYGVLIKKSITHFGAHVSKAWKDLAQACLMLFIFIFFIPVIEGLASDISDSASANLAGGHDKYGRSLGITPTSGSFDAAKSYLGGRAGAATGKLEAKFEKATRSGSMKKLDEKADKLSEKLAPMTIVGGAKASLEVSDISKQETPVPGDESKQETPLVPRNDAPENPGNPGTGGNDVPANPNNEGAGNGGNEGGGDNNRNNEENK